MLHAHMHMIMLMRMRCPLRQARKSIALRRGMCAVASWHLAHDEWYPNFLQIASFRPPHMTSVPIVLG